MARRSPPLDLGAMVEVQIKEGRSQCKRERERERRIETSATAVEETRRLLPVSGTQRLYPPQRGSARQRWRPGLSWHQLSQPSTWNAIQVSHKGRCARPGRVLFQTETTSGWLRAVLLPFLYGSTFHRDTCQ